MAGNVEKLRKAHQAFSSHSFDEAMDLVSLETTVTDHGRNQTINSREQFRGWLEAFQSMASDIRIVDANYIDGGEWVTALFRATGTQDGAMGLFPPSGQPFSLDVCEVWRFNAEGEAVEGHNYSDGLGLLVQLGHVKQPG